jgi:shikimate dehydrogenase
MIKATTRLVALIGNPAKHSLSPQIQNYFLRKYNIDAVYVVFEVDPENLKECFYGAKSFKFIGINITMPFKENIIKYIDNLDEAASAMGSVNTVYFREEESYGTNTDHEGFTRPLKDKGFSFKDRVCLVIGSGGVAKSTVYALIKNEVKTVYLYNRTKERAIMTARIFSSTDTALKVVDGLEDLDGKYHEIELIINCSSLGMMSKDTKDLLPIPQRWHLKDKYVFEMVYNPIHTPFIKKAQKDGSKMIIDGIDMLVSQAASSFEKWFNIYPDTHQITQYLKNSINNNI